MDYFFVSRVKNLNFIYLIYKILCRTNKDHRKIFKILIVLILTIDFL